MGYMHTDVYKMNDLPSTKIVMFFIGNVMP